MKIKLLIIVFIITLLSTNCTSVKKYNSHIDSQISVDDLQTDIDYVERKLNKLHPSLDWYISKEDLAKKFDSLRNSIQKPMKPNEFYMAISPVVASVKQGHMGIIPLIKKVEKKENKALNKKGKLPLQLMKFKFVNNELLLYKNFSKDTLLKLGSKIISVNDVNPKELFEKYRKSYTSDGLNTTFIPYAFADRFSTYFLKENEVKDSLRIKFSYKDSIYERTIARVGLKKADSIKEGKKEKVAVKQLTKEEKIVQKAKNKKENLRKKLFLFDETSKEFTRELKYIPADSSIAVLKISGFQHTKHKKAYDSIFNEIKHKKVETLILDLRNNGGGSLAEIHNLYGYLTPVSYLFIDNPKVMNRTGVATNKLRNLPKVGMVILSPFLLYTTAKQIINTRKDESGNFYLKTKESKITEPKQNRFDGKLYVLINGRSFSASCILSSNLKGSKRAFFVGEETGGTYNGTVAGTMPILTLPNSKLPFRIGLQDIRPYHKTEEFGRGIMPDKEIIPTIEQIENNEDPELEWILQDIAHKK